ncbi:DotA/TraY family protein [Acinetobacter sp. Marseille-Q1618]|uniref:DotA/TraY family protein n=1 Tax=Acinetobacter sp. Marseille-Q1618 TaxID=2697502 RepID=UPI001571422D|nr:DotA/TraY family protein [Acinetobacter sp. Marseille-Q1618]
MSIFCPIASDSTCQNDKAVELLGDIFGKTFINAFVNGNSAAATPPPAGDLVPVLFGALGHMALVFAAFLFLVLIFNSVLHTAQDGEVFGQGSKKGTVIIRFVTAVIFLMPTASMYSVVNVLLIMIVLASNGITNKANHEILKTQLQNPSMSYQSIQNNDTYGYRAYSIQKLRQYHCVNVLNSNYAAEGVKVGDKIYADGSISYKQEIGGELIYRGEFVDNAKIIDIGMFGAICGTSDYIVTSNSGLGLNIKYLTQPQDSIEYKNFKNQLMLQVQFLKLQGVSRLNTQLQQFSLTLPYIGTDPTAFGSKFKAAFDNKALDKIIQDEINRTDNEIANYLLSQKNSFVSKTVDHFAQRGWTQVAYSKQTMAQIQKDINEAKTKVSYRGTNPDLISLKVDGSSGEKEKVMYNLIVTQMDSAINNYMREPYVANKLTENDLKNVVPEDLSNEDVSFKRIAADVEDANTNMVMNAMKLFINGFTGTDENSANKAIKVDALTRMQTTGNMLYASLTVMESAITGLRVVLSVGGAGAAIISDNAGSAASIAIGLVDYLAGKFAKLFVLGKLVAIYLAVIIPTLPYVFFLMAVIGWLLHILQAMVGLILWSVMHMIPERSFVGSQMQGYLTVIALFFRPMLILMGFYLAYVLSDPVLTFTTSMFFSIMGAVQFTSMGFVAAVMQFFLLMAWVFLYCSILVPIIFLIFGLPSSLADTVIAWLGTNLSRSLGETNLAQGVGSAGGKAADYYGSTPKDNGGGEGGSGGGGKGGFGSGDGTVLTKRSNSTSKASGSQVGLPDAMSKSGASASGGQAAQASLAAKKGAAAGGLIGAGVAYGATKGIQAVQNLNSSLSNKMGSFGRGANMFKPKPTNLSKMNFTKTDGNSHVKAPMMPNLGNAAKPKSNQNNDSENPKKPQN